MSNWKTDFLKYICQTSGEPLGLDIVRGEGSYIFTRDGRRYLDLISGIGVVNIGHGRREVIEAIREQAEQYLHPMVYGEFVMRPQVAYAKALAEHLPGEIENIFFANSGAEAVEGALKTARKFTGRAQIYSFTGCYHGDAFGALACQSEPRYKTPFEPLVPKIDALAWHSRKALENIDEQTAAVIIEPVQGEGGVRIPSIEYVQALRERCDETGTLLIFDEVMTGFGRTGKLFAAEHFGVAPDIILLAKALGGGLPLGAFAARKEIMQTLSHDPPLAHVTTFGGNPVCCAAGHAAFQILLREKLAENALKIGARFVRRLKELRQNFDFLKEIRGLGCFVGVDFETSGQTMQFTKLCLQNGLIVGWTLHHSNILRMAPPLILTEEQVDDAIDIMKNTLQRLA